MATLAISTVIDVTITVNLCPLGNIFILLMKIQLLIFLVQPGISAKIVADLLLERLYFIIPPKLPMNIVIMLPNQALLSPNMMTLPLCKSNLPHLQLLPAISKGGKQLMKILMVFNGRVSTDIFLYIQLIILTLEELFPLTLPLNMHQYIKQ